MTAPVFGVDIDCPKCFEIHPAAEDCREVEISDRAWLRKAALWLDAHHGEEVPADLLTSRPSNGGIGRPLNDKIIGALWRRWQMEGRVVKGATINAKSPKRHGGTLRVWRIL